MNTAELERGEQLSSQLGIEDALPVDRDMGLSLQPQQGPGPQDDQREGHDEPGERDDAEEDEVEARVGGLTFTEGLRRDRIVSCQSAANGRR